MLFSKDLQLIELTETNKKTFYRYRKAIRSFLKVQPWSEQAANILEITIKKAALSMSNPADLVNVAIEKLIERRYELPAFSTLDRLVSHLRHGVHLDLYKRLDATLHPKQKTDVLNEMNAGGEIVTRELVEKLSPLVTQ